MTTRDNGGPAFPTTQRVAVQDGTTAGGMATGHFENTVGGGLTLRDYFAGQAMAAIIIGNDASQWSQTVGAALDAYAVADAMLEARTK